MSRDIKFRIWIKEEKRYLPQFVEDNDAGDGYGPLEYDNYYIAPETGAIIKQNNHRDLGDWMYSVEGMNVNAKVELEQYTGLKDKNGKEIYEGDIVNIQGIKYYVDFEHGGFWFNNDNRKWKSNRPFTHFQEINDTEVIGNVHENPELLEGKNE